VTRALAGLKDTGEVIAPLNPVNLLFKKYGISTVYSLYILECMKLPEKFSKKT
jgi:hypothetical protein